MWCRVYLVDFAESLDPVVTCVSTSPGALNSLLELVTNFQQTVVQTLAKSSHLNKQHEVTVEYQLAGYPYFIWKLQCISQHNDESDRRDLLSTQGGQLDLDGLNSQFADIQAAMEAYLSTATNPIAGALRFVPYVQ